MDLHEQVLRYAPRKVEDIGKYLAKPRHFIIAVEWHDKDKWDHQPEDRFLWIKARNTTRVEEIRDAYAERYNISHSSLLLKHGDQFPSLKTTMHELNCQGDQHVVLCATDGDNVQQSGSDSSTSEVKVEVSELSDPGVDRSHMASSTEPSSRQVLQPVNRQLANLPGPDINQAKPQWNPLVDRAKTRLPWNALDENGSTGVTEPAVSPRYIPVASPLKNDNFRHLPPDSLSESFTRSPQPHARVKDETSATCRNEDNDPAARGRWLRELALVNIPERLEAGVTVGVKLLSQLEDQITQLPAGLDSKAWLDQVAKVQQEAVKSRTVVGVVGNTGAGKSSVINAILDEERLVPTNCMRACTAVVTELSYNYSISDASKYRAQVEFIKPEDWRKELHVLYNEAFDERGNVASDTRNADSEAAIALAKIRAVYNKYTTEMLGQSSVDKLMKVKSVESILGTTRNIREQFPDAFYRRLQHYVDSKEKGTEKRDTLGRIIVARNRHMEFWPLIKVVRIFTKADALSTGAVIVDLPGVHDSNAARAAVAEGYMKQCTGLWIVAPITRAVDDKAAKTLLGDTFKRQLKYDGTYSAVTFICSKTDDISKTEAIDSLQLGDEMTELENQLTEIVRKRRALATEVREARGTKQDFGDAIEDIDTALEMWEELQTKIEDGKTVYAPALKSNKKRKRSEDLQDARVMTKRRKQRDSDDESSSDGFSSDGEDVAAEPIGPPLTMEKVEDEIADLKRQKKDARKQRSNMVEKCRELDGEIQVLQARENEIIARQDQLCIAGRNNYSREAIRQDFAAGIKELDQENALEEDEDNFDPDNDLRDYEEVARSLPVYCVSSRAYQKLCGHLEKDSDVAGFTTKEETEIPALQAHCKKLTETGRQATCRRFLNSLTQLVASLGLWASDDGTGSTLTNQQRDTEKDFLGRQLKKLEKSLEEAVRDILEDATSTLTEQLFDHFGSAAGPAATQANATADHWSAPRHEGGLHFMTYRATTRRSGVYAGASGFQDFNAQLAEPIYKQLATNWERAFQRRLPQIFNRLTKTAIDLLKNFHTAIESRCRESGHGIARIGMLSHNLTTHLAILSDIATSMVNQVNDATREINRQFTPVIADAMEPAYAMCNNESGTGSFKRIKAHMDNHVSYMRASAFNDACEKVKLSLAELFQHVETSMLDRVDGVFLSVQRDYMSVVGNVDIQVNQSREERAARRGLDDTIDAYDASFQSVLLSKLEELNQDHSELDRNTEHDVAMDDPDDDKPHAEEFSGHEDSDPVGPEDETDEDDEHAERDYQPYLDATEELIDEA